jgi:predicted TIM-barrel fold metal-dependent hydrolase
LTPSPPGSEGISDEDRAVYARAAAPYVALLRRELPTGLVPLDVHTHLGLDEDGRSMDPERLTAALDEASVSRACVFALHDPARVPAYRGPNDQVLAWAAASEGRFIPFCRLDPSQEPLAEAERCLRAGARGVKLHPHSDGFDFHHPAMARIFDCVTEAQVPLIVHAGVGDHPILAGLIDLVLERPRLTLIVGHAGVADQGQFVTRLHDHPGVYYDTAWFMPADLFDLCSRVSPQRVLFGSDPPYGRPLPSMVFALRLAEHSGFDASMTRGLLGENALAALGERPRPAFTPPRGPRSFTLNGRLGRVYGLVLMALGAVLAANVELLRRMLPLSIALCRDPDPGSAGDALHQIGELLAAVERLSRTKAALRGFAVPLLHLALTLSATDGATSM